MLLKRCSLNSFLTQFSCSLCVRDVSRNLDCSIPCVIATPWSWVTRSVLAMMVPCSTLYIKEQVTSRARAAGTRHQFQLYCFIINSPEVAIHRSLGSYLLRDEITYSWIQNEACQCLFVHQGRMRKALDQVTQPWHQEAFHIPERERGAYDPPPLLLKGSHIPREDHTHQANLLHSIDY